jgi:AcrR family transcriptional regulator
VSGQPGRKRDPASRQAILEAAFALLREGGFASFSIEGVAARAGVGKTTIYRWWASKGMLAVEAFLVTAEPQIAFPESASTRADIVQQMQSLAALYRGPVGQTVRDMLGAAQHDSAMREAFNAGFLEPRRQLARAVFQRGVARGQFQFSIDADVAIDALWAPIYYRMLVSGAAIDEAFVVAHADIVLRGLGVQPERGDR